MENLEKYFELGEIEELEAQWDARQSFYKKAFVATYKNYIILKSYSTIVAYIDTEKEKNYTMGKYSQTTTRHQKEFFKQFGYNKNIELVKEI